MIRKDHVKPVTFSPPARFGKPPVKTVCLSCKEQDKKLLFAFLETCVGRGTTASVRSQHA